MRYDKRIEFVYRIYGEYDPLTGNYLEDSETLKPVYASVMDTGTDLLTMAYGRLKQGSKTVQIQNHCHALPDRIRIDGKDYVIDFRRQLKTKEVFVVSEVQS